MTWFKRLLLLLQASGFVKLTRKASLVSAASALPRNISDIRETMLVPGYITNVTNDACYVRFLGQLTGRAGLAQLADVFVSDPSRHYQVGQSVRAQVVQVSILTSIHLKSHLATVLHDRSHSVGHQNAQWPICHGSGCADNLLIYVQSRMLLLAHVSQLTLCR